MRFAAVLVSLAAALSVAAQGDGHNPDHGVESAKSEVETPDNAGGAETAPAEGDGGDGGDDDDDDDDDEDTEPEAAAPAEADSDDEAEVASPAGSAPAPAHKDSHVPEKKKSFRHRGGRRRRHRRRRCRRGSMRCVGNGWVICRNGRWMQWGGRCPPHSKCVNWRRVWRPRWPLAYRRVYCVPHWFRFRRH